ncbi:uncharacterized protein LOC115455511 isoform X1 [Manduca sexta]|uniref:uncharacterized protein LOC115455511 isoform X1 n=1 Tax=Manduca sexta TaxID=7130 RepID=UPI0018908D1D|nr:uncharacterized protein LOC115455511 isoform X1 [Manduca sexta]
MVTKERQILTDFIELYHDFPCLWNSELDSYKNRNERNMAWELLADKLKELEPKASVATAKKKIEHLRTAFRREYRKVVKSKRGLGSVHVPSLWYYKLISFIRLNRKKPTTENDSIESDEISDEESSEKSEDDSPDKSTSSKRLKADNDNGGLQTNRRKLLNVVEKILEQTKDPLNPFGVYVGEQLLEMNNFQRQVAEKLISDVIFLAKSEALGFDSKVKVTNPDTENAPSPYVPSSPDDVKPAMSPEFVQPQSAESSRSSSPAQYIKLSLSPEPNSPPASPHKVDTSPVMEKAFSSDITQESSAKNDNEKTSLSQVIWSSPSTKIIQTSTTYKKIRLSPRPQSFQTSPVKSGNIPKIVLSASSLKKIRLSTNNVPTSSTNTILLSPWD